MTGERNAASARVQYLYLLCAPTLRRAQISIPVWQRTPWTGPRRYSSRLTNRPTCYRSPSERGGAHTLTRVTPRDRTAGTIACQVQRRWKPASQIVSVQFRLAMYRTAPHRIRSPQANSVERDFSTAPFLVSNRIHRNLFLSDRQKEPTDQRMAPYRSWFPSLPGITALELAGKHGRTANGGRPHCKSGFARWSFWKKRKEKKIKEEENVVRDTGTAPPYRIVLYRALVTLLANSKSIWKSRRQAPRDHLSTRVCGSWQHHEFRILILCFWNRRVSIIVVGRSIEGTVREARLPFVSFSVVIGEAIALISSNVTN